MEIFLQLYDDLDDMGGMLGLLWNKIAAFVLACVLFAATGILCVLFPKILLAVAAVSLSAALLETARNRRGAPRDAADR